MLASLAPQPNDYSRYAEYEISESNLEENDYHPYNEGQNDERVLAEDFTPYIEEENGIKIPILPAPSPNNVM